MIQDLVRPLLPLTTVLDCKECTLLDASLLSSAIMENEVSSTAGICKVNACVVVKNKAKYKYSIIGNIIHV